MQEVCDNCGEPIDDENETSVMCTECGVMMCQACDAATGVCEECEGKQ